MVYSYLDKYLPEVVTVKKYGDRYKFVWHKNLRVKGIEENKKTYISHSCDDVGEFEKSDASIIRSKSRIEEIVLCNKWDYFITVTISPDKYDRNDLNKFRTDFTRYLRNLRRKGYDIKYLLIPEEHTKGGWHMHGFIAGLPINELRLFEKTERLPYYILGKLDKGQKVYDWPGYRKKFGFVDVEEIGCKNRAANYVKKYITKDLERTVREQGANLYYCSQGLNRAELVYCGKLNECIDMSSWWSNDYCKVKWVDGSVYELAKTHYLVPNVYIPDILAYRKRDLESRTPDGFIRSFDVETGEITGTPFDDVV